MFYHFLKCRLSYFYCFPVHIIENSQVNMLLLAQFLPDMQHQFLTFVYFIEPSSCFSMIVMFKH